MPRYFIEVSYKGTHYSGFQVQKNANSIQAEVEKALHLFYKEDIKLTGSSRTDAGVHAQQNFFHFDTNALPNEKDVYHLNAILPYDIVVKKFLLVNDKAHCRFDAVSREYEYYIYQSKNPFYADRAFYVPYPINIKLLQQAAQEIMQHQDFATFCKRNTQAKTTLCNIINSYWKQEQDVLSYHVSANRFLRGMVRGMVGTMLQVAKNKITIEQFTNYIILRDCTKANFSVPPQGLFLKKVNFLP